MKREKVNKIPHMLYISTACGEFYATDKAIREKRLSAKIVFKSDAVRGVE